MNPDVLPLAMIAAGIIVLLAAIRVLVHQRRILEVVPSSDVTIELPKKWDDTEITRLLQHYHDRPAVLSYAVSSSKSRLIMNQDLKTAQQRLKLIASVIELFKLNKELQGILYDIQLAEKDFEIRQVESQIKLEDTQARLTSERQLRELRQQRDGLQLQKEITQLRQDITTVGQTRLKRLKELKQEALKLDDSNERIQKVNAIDDEIQREMEEWGRTL